MESGKCGAAVSFPAALWTPASPPETSGRHVGFENAATSALALLLLHTSALPTRRVVRRNLCMRTCIRVRPRRGIVSSRCLKANAAREVPSERARRKFVRDTSNSPLRTLLAAAGKRRYPHTIIFHSIAIPAKIQDTAGMKKGCTKYPASDDKNPIVRSKTKHPF